MNSKIGRRRGVACLVALVLALAVSAPAVAQDAGTESAARPGGDTWALIVGGINKDPEECQGKDRAVMRMRRLCVDAADREKERVLVLADRESFVSSPTGPSSRASITAALKTLAGKVSREDQFVFFYAGQANAIGEELRFNLRGDDLTHSELVPLLKKIPAKTRLVIIDCPYAGLIIKSLQDPAGITVCSSRSDQPYATRFSDYFLPAWADPESDENGDGQVSLLEAFQRACREVDEVFREQELMKTETAILEDNGDGVPSQQPWRYEQEAVDGRKAATFTLSRLE